MTKYRIIGIMSGTSLDGVDLAHCTFEEDASEYKFTIGACKTIPYPETWLSRLQSLPSSAASVFAETHTSYGKYLGELTRDFIKQNNLETDFVASHGHTIFHNPSQHYTFQIGEGAAITAECGLPVVCDFRTGDVAQGGQGAPLVPIGDELLFGQYDYCLNLGGFANISMRMNGKRIAYDISPVNIILNYLAARQGKLYDKNGEIAATGMVHKELLQTLNALSYYKISPPKSLSREWLEKEVIPLFTHYNINAKDALCTFCEHIAIQISACLARDSSKQMLITGGGAFNTFLINRIAAHTVVSLEIPDPNTVNYKEALIFAFLGLLRIQAKPNCLSTVTGSSKNVSGGAVYLP
jgi:anhydro-N-acetylmuramic acid kinase